MSGKAQGGPGPVPGQARAGGGCGSIPEAEALSDVLRSLSAQPDLPKDKQEEFQPRLHLLQQLTKYYEDALRNPSITDRVRAQILDNVKTPPVKQRVGPILQGLFDGTLGGRITQDIMDNILNCILDALTNDLPLTTLMSMVCMMFIKAFYDDSPVRLALGAAFVGSVGYLTWVGGMNHIFGLGRESVILILSAMAQCAHITQEALYSETLRKLLGPVLVGSIGDYIDYLLPSAGGIFAMSTVYLMGLIYGPDIFPARDELHAADSSPAAAEARAAAAAAGGGVAQAPLQSGVLPVNQATADAAAAAAAAAAAVPGNSVFRQMFQELQGAAVVVGTNAKNHLVTLGGLARRIESTRPGQVGGQSPENRWYNLANVFFQACVSKTFTVFNEQAGRAGLSAVDVSAKHLLSACLPSDFRTEGDLEAREEIFILAHKIKSIVIDCLVANPPGMKKEQATSYLEEAFPVFSSGLTEANVDRLTASQLSSILSALIKASRTVDFPKAESEEANPSQEESQRTVGSEQSEWSRVGVPPPSPLHVRLALIEPDFNQTLRLFQGVFRTTEEADRLKEWLKRHLSYFNKMFGCFDVMVGTIAQKARHNQLLQSLGANAANATRDIVNQLIPGVEPRNAAIFQRFPELQVNFATPTRFLTGPWIRVLNHITQMTEEGMPYEDIVNKINELYKIKDLNEFKAYIKALILRLNIEFLINRGGDCSVQPAIIRSGTDENGVTYRAVLVLNLPRSLRIDSEGELQENIHLPIECFKEDVVVPSQASALLQTTKGAMTAAKNAASSWLSSLIGLSSCAQEQAPPAPPAAPAVLVAEEAPAEAPKVLVNNILNSAVEGVEKVITEAEKRAAEKRAEAGAAPEAAPEEEKVVDCGGALLLPGPLEIATEILSSAEAMVGFVSQEQAQKVIDDEALQALSALGGSAIQFTVQPENPSPADTMQNEEVTQLTGSSSGRPLSRAAARKMEDEQNAAAEKEQEQGLKQQQKKSKNAGKSRTRRRRPATAKRTRRKAYNKKSNKRKSSKQLSRKQLSRRRQSRRK